MEFLNLNFKFDFKFKYFLKFLNFKVWLYNEMFSCENMKIFILKYINIFFYEKIVVVFR